MRVEGEMSAGALAGLGGRVVSAPAGLAAGGVVSGGKPAASPRLVSAAHEFEAAMMKELLAPMQAGHDALLGNDGDEDGGDDTGLGASGIGASGLDASGGALGDFAADALGKAISAHGGFGMATSILRQLSGAGQAGASPLGAGLPGAGLLRDGVSRAATEIQNGTKSVETRPGNAAKSRKDSFSQ